MAKLFAKNPKDTLNIGVLSFYKSQILNIQERAKQSFSSEQLANVEFGTVDSFQGKEFDVVILSATRSNDLERTDSNVRKIFGFLTSENRLHVAFSRAQRLLIVCGDSEMFNDDYAQTYVNGLYEFYVNQSTNKNYGARII
jgi:superfamily I DNA and/or RNA helicase